jgi:hypothetical protein
VYAAGGGPVGAQVAGVESDLDIVALDQFGNPFTGYTGTVEVSVTAGTLSTGGGTSASFTAGALEDHAIEFAAQAANVKVQVADGAITGESVTFQVAAGGAEDNEPAGMTMQRDRGFLSVTETGWGNTTESRMLVQDDETAPTSQPKILRMLYPVGFGGGSAPCATFPSGGLTSRHIRFVRLALKFSSNFQSHSSGTNKLVHFNINASNRVFLQARNSGLAPGFGVQNLAEIYPNPGGGLGNNLMQNIGSGAQLTRDVWHILELLMVANAAGVADGELHMWLKSGAGSMTKIAEWTGIMFCGAGGNDKWEGFNISPTWGGSADTVDEEMYLWWDHFYISGKDV